MSLNSVANTLDRNNSAAQRNIWVDLLRGLSALFVVLLHCNIHLSIGDSFIRDWLPSKLYSLLFWSGYNGVVVFFTLSGYLITLSALRKWGALGAINVPIFYALRAARILPLLGLLLFILSVLHSLNVPSFTLNPAKVSLSEAIFSTLTFQMNWLQVQIGYLPANWDILWTISIEESFYIVFPLLCVLARSEKQLIAFLTIFFLVSPWARVAWFPDNPLGDRNHLAYVDSMTLGCVAALVTVRMPLSSGVKRSAKLLGIALLGLSFLFKGELYRLGVTHYGLNITLLSLGVACFLLSLNRGRRGTRVNSIWRHSINWLMSWGHYSYEIYLSHMFVVILIAMYFKQYELGESYLLQAIMLVLLLSFALGKLLFVLFTNPINQFFRSRLKIRPCEP